MGNGMTRLASWVMLIMILLNVFAFTSIIQPAAATGTIYIRADGSIDPPTAPITTADNMTYTLTANITGSGDGIIVERDNIIIEGGGYMLRGDGTSRGIHWSSRTNVTVQNGLIDAFGRGIEIWGSSGNSISGNRVTTNNGHGIVLVSCSNNRISGNNITASNSGCSAIWLGSSSNYNSISGNRIAANNYCDGICLYYSSNNNIFGNKVAANNGAGIWLDYSSNNDIVGNNVTDNAHGISLYSYSSGNKIYHNNFKDNVAQTYISASVDTWDNGYPSGGNYWSDYKGADLYSGSYQNETGSDGMGDTPYVLDAYNLDKYPLMKPYPWDPHDIGITYVGRYWDFVPVVLPLKTIAGIGLALHVNVFVMNYGDSSEVFDAIIFANNTATNTTGVGSATNVVLATKSSIILDFVWNTASFAKGNYTINVSVSTVPGETRTADNSLQDGTILITIPGDVNGDRKVDLKDVFAVAKAYGSQAGDTKYNSNLDTDDNGKTDLKDYYTACKNYGKSW